MEIQGKIIAALDVKTGSSARGEWKVQEFVLETLDGQYSRKMVFSVFGAERLQLLNIQVGQDVNVRFDIDAREYNGRWFNSIRAYDVRPVQDLAAAPAAAAQVPPPPFANAPTPPNPSTNPFSNPAGDDGGSDELPF